MALTLPEAVRAFLAQEGHGRAVTTEAAGGGCISNGKTVTTSTGAQFFLKTHDNPPPDLFAREAEGLAALAAAPGGPRVPRALLVGAEFLLLEHLATARPHADYWARLGEGLAHLHGRTQERFGFDHDNYIGLTPQLNTWEADGWRFFAEHRLRHMGRVCAERGVLNPRDLGRLERVAARLPDLIPSQAPSLLHGDLWSGNIVPGPDGDACLIDPAAHYGWAEADLAMMGLFGRPPRELYDAYTARRPLEAGFHERFEVYNLYHLLNHLALFGGGYGETVAVVLRRYG